MRAHLKDARGVAVGRVRPHAALEQVARDVQVAPLPLHHAPRLVQRLVLLAHLHAQHISSATSSQRGGRWMKNSRKHLVGMHRVITVLAKGGTMALKPNSQVTLKSPVWFPPSLYRDVSECSHSS